MQEPVHNENSALHIPVLLPQVLETLFPAPGERYLDLTAGYGGHARAVFQYTDSIASSVLVDRDQFALDHLGDLGEKGATLLHTDYHAAAQSLHAAGETFDLILMDIGVSSPQLDLADRGFSFMHEGLLDMRMDQTTGKSAADLINSAREDELARIITEYGEEPRSRAARMAHALVRARPFTRTSELADVITEALGGRRGKIHPATKTFQAIRLAVNDELGQLRETLPMLPELLNPGGRVAVISFHSLEDRIVKNYFKEQADAGFEATLKILTPKPIEGSQYDTNPRARSAKLRAAVKI